MTGFNMPPGVSPSDIPGNNAPDPSPESEEVLGLLESAEGRCPPQYYCDKICEVVERIVEERNRYKAALEDAARIIDSAIPRTQAS